MRHTKSEQFDKVKDANQKLRSENRSLRKQVQQLRRDIQKLQESMFALLDFDGANDLPQNQVKAEPISSCPKCQAELISFAAGPYLIHKCTSCSWSERVTDDTC